MKEDRTTFFSFFAFILSSLTPVLIARAQDDAASLHYSNGAAAFANNDFKGAVDEFNQSWQSFNAPVTAYYISYSYSRLYDATDTLSWAQTSLNMSNPSLDQTYVDGANDLYRWAKGALTPQPQQAGVSTSALSSPPRQLATPPATLPQGSITSGRSNLRCAAYAQMAVTQNQLNIDKSCGFTGSRWQPDAQYHTQWCASTSVSAINVETDARQAALNECASRTGKDTFCAIYASTATEQNKINQDSRCGLSGTRWSSDFGFHLQWCQGVPLQSVAQQANGETAARQQLLNRCLQ